MGGSERECHGGSAAGSPGVAPHDFTDDPAGAFHTKIQAAARRGGIVEETAVNFLTGQVLSNGGKLPDGPHFVHCYIYGGHHCSCGGNYRGDQPGPDVNLPEVRASIVNAAEETS